MGLPRHGACRGVECTHALQKNSHNGVTVAPGGDLCSPAGATWRAGDAPHGPTASVVRNQWHGSCSMDHTTRLMTPEPHNCTVFTPLIHTCHFGLHSSHGSFTAGASRSVVATQRRGSCPWVPGTGFPPLDRCNRRAKLRKFACDAENVAKVARLRTRRFRRTPHSLRLRRQSCDELGTRELGTRQLGTRQPAFHGEREVQAGDAGRVGGAATPGGVV